MAGFTKLFSSIVTSSVWSEDDKTRIMWVTMLALADARGHVDGAIPGLAAVARMTTTEAETAIRRLEAPDPYSRTAEHDGRRIEKEPGGWVILNYLAYRERGQEQDGSRAAYMRRYRQRNKRDVTNVTCDTEAEAEAEAYAETERGADAPTPADVDNYGAEVGYPIDGKRFCAYYAARGWQLSGGLPMSNWRAAVDAWRQRERAHDPVPGDSPPPARGADGLTPRERFLRQEEADNGQG